MAFLNDTAQHARFEAAKDDGLIRGGVSFVILAGGPTVEAGRHSPFGDRPVVEDWVGRMVGARQSQCAASLTTRGGGVDDEVGYGVEGRAKREFTCMRKKRGPRWRSQ